MIQSTLNKHFSESVKLMMQAGAQSQKPAPEWAGDIIQREFRTE